MRLIDADKIEYPEYFYSKEASPDPFVEGFHQGKIDAICEIKALTPTIDPASLRPKGEWIETGYKPYWFTKCSLCGYRVIIEEKTNFCPNCGADMRGNDDN